MSETHNVGINLDDQFLLYGKPGDDPRILGQGGFMGEFQRRFGDGNKVYLSKGEMARVWAEMLKFATNRLYELGFDGYIKINEKYIAQNKLVPEVIITGRIDKKQQGYFDSGIDIERKQFDANKMSSKEMRKAGYNTDLLQG